MIVNVKAIAWNQAGEHISSWLSWAPSETGVNLLKLKKKSGSDKWNYLILAKETAKK